MPPECRDRVKGSEYTYGCGQQFAWWLEPWTATLAGVCVTFLLIHVAQMVVINKMVKYIRRYERASNYEYED